MAVKTRPLINFVISVQPKRAYYSSFLLRKTGIKQIAIFKNLCINTISLVLYICRSLIVRPPALRENSMTTSHYIKEKRIPKYVKEYLRTNNIEIPSYWFQYMSAGQSFHWRANIYVPWLDKIIYFDELKNKM